MLVSIFLIKLAAGIHMIIFGIHQFVHPERWYEYLPQWAQDNPGTPRKIIRVNALGNLIIAVFLASGMLTIVAAWLAFIWNLALLPLAFIHDWRVGIHDLTITICLLSLVYLVS